MSYKLGIARRSDCGYSLGMDTPLTPLTDAQRAFLVDLGIGREVFAPHPSTMRALRERGLIQTRFIGQRWWWCQPTKTAINARDSVVPT